MPSRRALARVIVDQLIAGEDTDLVMRRLAAYMHEHRLLGQREYIISTIAELLAERGSTNVEVTSAHGLSEALRDEISRFVERKMDGHQVQLNETVYPKIIGGIIIKTPTRIYDASVRTQLKRLRTS